MTDLKVTDKRAKELDRMFKKCNPINYGETKIVLARSVPDLLQDRETQKDIIKDKDLQIKTLLDALGKLMTWWKSVRSVDELETIIAEHKDILKQAGRG